MELLNEDRQRELLAQPESRMGYQRVEVFLRDGNSRLGTVFSTEYLLYSEEPADRLKESPNHRKRILMFERNELGVGDQILSLKVRESEAGVSSRVQETSVPRTASSGASEAPEEVARRGEIQTLLSLFQRSPRNSLWRAVARYVCNYCRGCKARQDGARRVKQCTLPNPKPAVHVFTIGPPLKTKLKGGIAQPAYGQPGGGVEVIFCERLAGSKQ